MSTIIRFMIEYQEVTLLFLLLFILFYFPLLIVRQEGNKYYTGFFALLSKNGYEIPKGEYELGAGYSKKVNSDGYSSSSHIYIFALVKLVIG